MRSLPSSWFAVGLGSANIYFDPDWQPPSEHDDGALLYRHVKRRFPVGHDGVDVCRSLRISDQGKR